MVYSEIFNVFQTFKSIKRNIVTEARLSCFLYSMHISTIFNVIKSSKPLISAQLSLTKLSVQELMLCKMEVSVSVHLELIISVENVRFVLLAPSLMEPAANNPKLLALNPIQN